MDWKKEILKPDEEPLEILVDGLSLTSIFRKVAFVGDSLSSGEFESLAEDGSHGYHDMFEYSWGQYIARREGFTALNFSRGGMTAKEYMESFAQANGFWDEDKACQAYVYALGVNDLFGWKMDVGSPDDIDKDDWRNNKPTFMGYMAQIIARYKEIQPRAVSFLVAMPREDDDDHNAVVEKHAKALYELAEIFDNTYVIDLKRYGPVYDAEFKKNMYMGGHLNPAGYVFTARMIDSYIDYIIRNNMPAFRETGYIGTDLHYPE